MGYISLIPIKKIIKHPSINRIKAVPKSGWIATRINIINVIINGIIDLETCKCPLKSKLWKYFARYNTRKIFANSEIWRLIKPSLSHLLAPIPVNPKKRVKRSPITMRIKKTSHKLKIILGLSINIKKNNGINTKNLINWFLAHGSKDPDAAENKLISPIQKMIIINRK